MLSLLPHIFSNQSKTPSYLRMKGSMNQYISNEKLNLVMSFRIPDKIKRKNSKGEKTQGLGDTCLSR